MNQLSEWIGWDKSHIKMNMIKRIKNLNELDAMIKSSEWIGCNESIIRMNWMRRINNLTELDENTDKY